MAVQNIRVLHLSVAFDNGKIVFWDIMDDYEAMCC